MAFLNVLCHVLLSVLVVGDAVRILAVVPSPFYSHQMTFQPIWRELSLRGHQVTTITTDIINDPSLVNLTEIDLHSIYTSVNVSNRIHSFTDGKSTIFEEALNYVKLFEKWEDFFLSHQDVQNLIKNNTEKFDLVIVELGFMPLTPFAKRFEAPLITISSLEATHDQFFTMGNPLHPIIYPDWYSYLENNVSLYDRIMAFINWAALRFLKVAWIVPIHQKLMDKHFGLNYPRVWELEKNISLCLLNSNQIFHKVKPLPANIIQFGGGFHKTAPKPLNTELQKILDSSEDGFIYFSLGSSAESRHLRNDTINEILETFGDLPYIILWKFEADFPIKPKNVITKKWFPQQDILRHPKIKLFITQGGLQSIEEAIYEYVPLIGLPVYGDQFLNVQNIVNRGFGIHIDYKTLGKTEFKTAILEVINNPKYRNRMKEMVKLAMDQPMTGLEKAIWWIEYVIRHNGALLLQSPIVNIPFYQYYMLDIMAVLAVILVLLIGFSIFVIKYTYNLLTVTTRHKKIKTK